ncbi:MAG: diaminopimelate decarboxylase [Thermoleophilia bacterium]
MSDRPTALLPFPDTATVGPAGIALDGVALTAIAEEYGTPLYVYDAASIRTRGRAVVDALATAPNGGHASFALKSQSTLAILRLIHELGIGADCASSGEIAAAERAGIPGSELVIHGNAKSEQDLRAAVEAGARFIVLDGRDEAERLSAICHESGDTQDVLVRIAPGIDVNTHRHIATGHHGSKFGVTPAEGAELLRTLPEGLVGRGLHVHLGSQILEAEPLVAAARWLPAFAKAEGIPLEVLDLGGGLGIRYTPDQDAPDPGQHTRNLIEAITTVCAEEGMPVPEVIVEPGRSIIGQSGVTLYTVIGMKTVGDGSTWVAVDGGMGDNMRVGLYGATYAPVLAARPTDAPSGSYRIAGRHCESTDVLAENIALPTPAVGDIVAFPATGAYHQTMAHSYNLFGRPAAVLVEGGSTRLITRRESIDDLFSRDV